MLTFRDDYLDLLGDDPRARSVAEHMYMLEEFLDGLRVEGTLELPFTGTRRDILFHGHCHQKALIGTGQAMAVMSLPPNYHVREIPSGCCGMAGSFGYESEHYDISMKVGEDRLFEGRALSRSGNRGRSRGNIVQTPDNGRHGKTGPTLGRGPGRGALRWRRFPTLFQEET